MSDNPLLDKMLDLPEFEITDLKHNEHDIGIYVHARERPSVCPSCGIVSPHLRVQQHRPQVVRDISIQHNTPPEFYERLFDLGVPLDDVLALLCRETANPPPLN